MERKRLFGLLASGCGIAIAAALLFVVVAEHWRTQSPDRAFVAVVQVERIYALVSLISGRGSEKPGYVTIYRGEMPCGSVWVPVVSLAYQLQWEVDGKPRRAKILAATWNLDECRIEQLFCAVIETRPIKTAAKRNQAA